MGRNSGLPREAVGSSAAAERQESQSNESAAAKREVALATMDALGFERLSRPQEEAILALVSGSDTLVVMPTGAGKSAIYQVAGSLIPGATIVISPLIALQRDQESKLASLNAGKALVLNSTLSERHRDEVLNALRQRKVEFLFMAPEQLQNAEVLAALKAAPPSLFVVDEAHCLVEWGYDFRPDYLLLARAIDALGRPPIAALTATAALPVRDEIIERLGMHEPRQVVSGLDRPNIWFGVERFDDEQSKAEGLEEALRCAERPGIVYCSTTKTAEAVAKRISERGWQASVYHGSLKAKTRSQVQGDFMSGAVPILVATKAFGLGVDKPDIRFVIHYDAPDSIDSLYQEAGRAGRDGAAARALLLFHPADLRVSRFFAGGHIDPQQTTFVLAAIARFPGFTRAALARETRLSSRALGRVINFLVDADVARFDESGRVRLKGGWRGDEAIEEIERAQERRRELLNSRIDLLRAYAETTACRRQTLLSYFGEFISPCGNCDNCEAGLAQASDEALSEPPGDRVRHESFGEGHVMSIEGERAVIFFPDAGYRRIDLKLAEEQQLLSWLDG